MAEKGRRQRGGPGQFFRDYWALTEESHRPIVWTAVIIVIMQTLAIVEPGMVTSMVHDMLHAGPRAKHLIKIKVTIALAILVVQSMIQWVKSRLVRRIAIGIEHGLMTRFLDRLLRLGGIFHETHNVGELQGTITRGVSKVTEMTFLFAHELVPLVVMFFVTTIAVTWYSKSSTLVIIVTFFIFLLMTLVTRVHKMKERQIRHKLHREIDHLFGSIVACVRTVWIFGQEEREIARLTGVQARIKAMLDSEYRLYDQVDFVRGIIIGFGRLGVVGVCLNQAFHDTSMIASLFLVLMLAERLFRLSYNVGTIFDRCVEAMKPIGDMMMVLAAPILITDPEHPIAITEIKMGIVYRGATFAYPTQPERLVLNGVDLDIRAGHTIGIVGGSGGGKSSLVKALLRFIDLDGGQLLIDGVDVRHFALRALRRLIGCVSQDVEISDGTVEDNIKYGKPEATRAEVERAAKLANIHDRILTFAGGYDARVGNEGQQLSGGERQRIAIARVLLVNPAVIVFDEATSAVDSESDAIIHEAIARLSAMGKTIIIIAHRLGTVRNADCIYCLEGGKVVESGTHDDLLKQRGRYHGLWTAHKRGSRGHAVSVADGIS